MSTTIFPLSAAVRPWSTNWIINQREDLTWFIGSGLVGYLALALMIAGFPVEPLYIIWMFGVDGPHVLATVTRTYCDKNERRRLGWLLWIIVPFLALGPIAVAFGISPLFYVFAICWQHFHIAKQHFGFMMLYKAKNSDRDKVDAQLDRWYLLSSLILPLAWFVSDTQQWIGAQLLSAAVQFATIFYVGFAFFYFQHYRRHYKNGITVNAPKMMLLVLLVPLQWVAFKYASQFGPEGIIRAGIALGLFHSLQYHRLLWFHNKNRYTNTENAQEKYGFAATLAKGGLGVYLLVAIGLNLLIAVTPIVMGTAIEMIKAGVWGFAFTHYVLDARIWHVRGDRDLASALQFNL